jgi:hypothetical protein
MRDEGYWEALGQSLLALQIHYNDPHLNSYISPALVHLASAKKYKMPEKISRELMHAYNYMERIPDAVEVADRRKTGRV